MVDVDKWQASLGAGEEYCRSEQPSEPCKETESYCRAVAQSADINVVSAVEAMHDRDKLFVVSICVNADVASDVATQETFPVADKDDLPPVIFREWRGNILKTNANLFPSLTGVPPPSRNNF